MKPLTATEIKQLEKQWLERKSDLVDKLLEPLVKRCEEIIKKHECSQDKSNKR